MVRNHNSKLSAQLSCKGFAQQLSWISWGMKVERVISRSAFGRLETFGCTVLWRGLPVPSHSNRMQITVNRECHKLGQPLFCSLQACAFVLALNYKYYMIHDVCNCSFSSCNSQSFQEASQSTITHKLKPHGPIELRDNEMSPLDQMSKLWCIHHQGQG